MPLPSLQRKRLHTMTEEAKRILNNLSRVTSWNSTVNPSTAEEIYESCGGSLYCNGFLRDVVITPITQNLFKIHTTEIK